MNELDLILLALLVSMSPIVVLAIFMMATLKDDPSTTDQPMSSDSPEINVKQTDIPEIIPYWGGWTTAYTRPYFSAYLRKYYP